MAEKKKKNKKEIKARHRDLKPRKDPKGGGGGFTRGGSTKAPAIVSRG